MPPGIGRDTETCELGTLDRPCRHADNATAAGRIDCREPRQVEHVDHLAKSGLMTTTKHTIDEGLGRPACSRIGDLERSDLEHAANRRTR